MDEEIIVTSSEISSEEMGLEGVLGMLDIVLLFWCWVLSAVEPG